MLEADFNLISFFFFFLWHTGSKSEQHPARNTSVLIDSNGPEGLGDRDSKTWLSVFSTVSLYLGNSKPPRLLHHLAEWASHVLISKQHLAELSERWVRAKGASHVEGEGWRTGRRVVARGRFVCLNVCVCFAIHISIWGLSHSSTGEIVYCTSHVSAE